MEILPTVTPTWTSFIRHLHRTTVGHLYDRLRMATAMVAAFQRETLVLENCQVEADESAGSGRSKE